jgi:hypothetical protein
MQPKNAKNQVQTKMEKYLAAGDYILMNITFYTNIA